MSIKISHKLVVSYVLAGVLLLITTGVGLFYFSEFSNYSEFINEDLTPLSDSSKDLRIFTSEAYTSIEKRIFSTPNESFAEIEKLLLLSQEEIDFLVKNIEKVSGIASFREINNVLVSAQEHTGSFVLASKEILKSELLSTGVGTSADEEFDALYDTLIFRLQARGKKQEYQTAYKQERIGNARYLLAHGHLLTAEILSGDFGEDFKEVTDSFDQAYEEVLALKVEDSEIVITQNKIRELKALAIQRYDKMKSLLEKKEGALKRFDQSYDQIHNDATALEGYLEKAVAAHQKNFSKSNAEAQTTMYAASILGVIFVVLMLVYVCLQVVGPFTALTGAIKKLNTDEQLESTPGLGREDEIGEMASVIEDFKKASVERQKLFAELTTVTDEATKANKAKSQFLANMSHEIRTPLNSIIGYSDILADDELSLEQRNMAGSIKNSSETLLCLVNDILDLAKVESGEMTLERIPVNLEDIVFEVGESQVAKIADKKLEVNVNFGDAYALVYSDPTRLKQVLINLVGNAIKFTEDGEVVIDVSVLEESEKSQKLRICVRDTGIGMTEGQTEVIFEAFKQADGSTTRKYGGTGLGLNITKQILACMNSEVQVKSTLGEGSNFYFDISFEKFAAEKKVEYDVTDIVNKKILIVDDNSTSQEILHNYIDKVGMSSHYVSSGAEAFEFLEKNEVDVLVQDLMMPDMDGYSVAYKVREAYPNIKQIAATADIRPGIIAKVKEYGFEAYLLKPIRRSVLYNTLQEIYRDKTDVDLLTEDKVSNSFTAKELLVVDDNKMNLKLASKIFTKMGHRVTLAESGKKCLELLGSQEFDLIFMDMQMPEMSGVETTQEIRKREIRTPVVALTANAFDSDRQECLAAGMDDFTTKPLRRNELHCLIQKYTQVDGEYIESRLLIVEDDETTSMMLAAIIEQSFPGATIKKAYDGLQALTLIGSFVPHIVILDFMLPDMDGLKVMEFLKNHDQYKNIKVLVNSSLSKDDERIVKLREMGVMGVLCKTDTGSQKEQLIDYLKKC